MDDKPRDAQWIDALVSWLTDTLKNEESMPQSTQPPEEILTAAALVRPNLTLPEIYSFLETAPSTERFLIVNRVLTAIGTPDVRHKQAEMLLKHADSVYPKAAELADASTKIGMFTPSTFGCSEESCSSPDMRNLAIAGKDLLEARSSECCRHSEGELLRREIFSL